MTRVAEMEMPSTVTDRNPPSGAQTRPLRVLALFETATISGPAKNFFQFCRTARQLSTAPAVDFALASFSRSFAGAETNAFTEASGQCQIPLYRIPEAFRFDLRVVKHLRQLAQEWQPDLIETHAVKSHAIVRASGLWRRTPWIAFHHGYTRTSLHSPLYNRLDRWSLRSAACVVTMNRVFARELAAYGIPAKRIQVLHNAVRVPEKPAGDCTARQAARESFGLGPEEKMLLCVGRLSREKAQVDAVAALRRLLEMQPGRSVRLVLLGDGPERMSIENAATAAGLNRNMQFAGHCGNVAPYYQAADVVVIPSLSEGSPNVLLEAMAFGVPVVATEVGGIPEIATHGETAWLVPPRQPQALAEAIHQILSAPDTAAQLTARARKQVAECYSPEARTRALIELYSQVSRGIGREGSPAGLTKATS